MKPSLILAAFLLCTGAASGQAPYRTCPLAPNIKTLQVRLNDRDFDLPLLHLDGSDVLHIQFDEMSHDVRSYSYRVLHCDADWTPSALASGEYLAGFPTGMVSEYALSTTTTYPYTNYKLSVPNDDMSFTKSGNYVLQVYEDNDPDHPVAQVCFCVVEPRVSIDGTIRGNTDTELGGRLQQLDFEVDLGSYAVNDPREELTVTVRQNNRTDNEVTGLKPTYLRGSVLSYVNNRALIFEGGVEYHRFDISSVYTGTNQIERIDYDGEHYDAYLYKDAVQPSRTYVTEPDVNGRYVINLQESHFDLDTDADYINVHFAVPRDEPFFDGQVYIGGDCCYNLLDEGSRMRYDFNAGEYFKTLLLKQGGYNYQYWFVPKGETRASVERVEGSFWEARTEYTVYVYHRPWGGRYDLLVGVETIEN